MNFSIPGSPGGRTIDSAPKSIKPCDLDTWYTVERVLDDHEFPWTVTEHYKRPGWRVRLTVVGRFPTEKLADGEALRLQRLAAGNSHKKEKR